MRRVSIEDLRGLEASVPDIARDPGEVCLATFWRQATPGQFYWRCDVPARHLPGQALSFQVSDLAWNNAEDHLVMPRHRGVGVWPYLGDDRRSRIAFAMQDLGNRTLIDVDDDYTRTPGRWHAGWSKTHEQAERGILGYSHEQHRHLAQMADGIIVSTPHLGDTYSGYNDKVYVCRNSIDPWDYRDIPRHEDDGILRIGFAGSVSHIFDYPLVKKALKWARRQTDVKVYMVGFVPPAWDGDVIPWADDLLDFRRNLGQLDVGLCALQDNPWNRNKSDIKAMEYAMAGALPIVSRTESFSPWWRDQNWYWTAQTPEQWADIIREVVSERDNISTAATAAKKYVMAERTIQTEISKWKEAILDG